MCAALAVGGDPLFPLPKFAEFDARPHPPRSSQRASVDRRVHCAAANHTVDSLNWLHGDADSWLPAGGCASGAQRSALKHIWSATSFAREECGVSEFGAARSLLGLGRAYGSAQSTKTAAYREGDVSLPRKAKEAVDLCGVLPSVARRFLEHSEQWLLHDDEGLAEAIGHASEVIPYSDPALKDPRAYKSFI